MISARKIVYCCSLILFFATSAQAMFGSNENINDQTNELNQVSQQIQGLQNSISQDRNQQENLQQQLQQTETKIGSFGKNLVDTTNQLKQENMTLAQLQAQQSSYQIQYLTQQSDLANDIRAEYMLGQHNYVKLLLSQSDAADASRMLVYYKYINQDRLTIISAIKKTLLQLATNKAQIQMHYQKLKQLQAQQTLSKTALENELQTRQQVLSQVNNSIQSKGQQLANLTANKQALENLIAKLKATAVNFPQPTVPFAQMQGKLQWPTQGQITEHYGSSVDGTSMAATGIFITAPLQQPVRAVYPGRVVFADWLRGVGLLIIIDHGNGFMTLYGHNYSLYKKTGDIVRAGDEIATVGQSGGDDQTGLYFQIRENGQPLNPEQWCK